MRMTARFWDRMYRRSPSWDLDRPDPLLLTALESRGIHGPGRALDVGCGTGDNIVALARLGFDATGIDLAPRALARARAKFEAAGVQATLLQGDVTDLDTQLGTFDVVVDRGLLMSLFGERARTAYAERLTALVAPGGGMYQHQWELPGHPRMLSPGWLAATTRGVVATPGEVERRFGEAFHVERLHRSIESTADPGIRRMGIREVAVSAYWLTRRSRGA